MAENWTFNGFALTSRGKRAIEEVIEGIGIPKYRGSDLQVPFQHGKRWIKKRFDSRKVVLSMWIKGSSRSDLDDNIDAFFFFHHHPSDSFKLALYSRYAIDYFLSRLLFRFNRYFFLYHCI